MDWQPTVFSYARLAQVRPREAQNQLILRSRLLRLLVRHCLCLLVLFWCSWAQLHGCCFGQDRTATRRSLQADNQLSAHPSFCARFGGELEHLGRFHRNLNTRDWKWLSELIYPSKSLLLTSSQKSNASLERSFFSRSKYLLKILWCINFTLPPPGQPW